MPDTDPMTPGPLVPEDDHLACTIRFVGKGGFVGFHAMLRDLESDLTFADVTDISISRMDQNQDDRCKFEWKLCVRVTDSQKSLSEEVERAPTP